MKGASHIVIPVQLLVFAYFHRYIISVIYKFVPCFKNKILMLDNNHYTVMCNYITYCMLDTVFIALYILFSKQSQKVGTNFLAPISDEDTR